MARTQHPLTTGLSGAIGKQLVFKKYGKKTVVSKYPDMSKVKPSTRQKTQRSLFAKAVSYAKRIRYTPALYDAYKAKLKKGQSVYQEALKEYMQQHKKGKL